MWRQVTDETGRIIHNGAFFRELRQNHQVTTKIELLDTRLREINGGNIFSKDRTNELTNFIVDGNIDVDSSRGIRRTAELSLLNPTAEFTPATENFDPEGPWVGKIYLNRIIRIHRGVYVGKQPMYVPVGTFMVDVADVIVEQNMSMVDLTLSDLWKKMSKAYFTGHKVYPADTPYNTIIREIIDSCGVQMTGKNGAIIDSLSERSVADRKTNNKIVFESGDSKGDKLKELTHRWGIDAYFNPMGVFVTEDRRDAKDRATAWRFYSSPDSDGMLISLKRSFSDDNLYNHVVVIGTGAKKGVVRVSKADTNPTSKTNINLLGDRMYLVESDQISTVAEANRVLNKAWKIRFQLSETIDAETICNPALEADDVINIEERDFIKVDGNYRLRRFNISLVTSRQSIQVANIIREVDV